MILRRAGLGDSLLLFQWVNRPDSLAGKLATQEPIARKTHDAWFAARLADPETFVWIIESDDKPVGQLRLMKKAGAYEVDIYVLPDRRRSGIAQEALKRGIEELKTARTAPQVLRASVKTENVDSQRLFERAGFLLCERHAGHLVYGLTAL
jgi:RimJ/RimL family protein N-acetyltransferase